MDPLRISQSEINTFLRCRRKWWLNNYRGLKPLVTEHIGTRPTGTRIHEVLAQYYQPGATGDALLLMPALAACHEQDWGLILAQYGGVEYVPDFVTADWRKTSDLEKAVLSGYVDWLAESGADSDLESIASEITIEVPFDVPGVTVPVSLIGKLDVQVLECSSGRRMIIDHKSAQSISQVEDKAQQDLQPLFYQLLQLLAYPNQPRVSGMLYNVLRKVKRTAAAKPPFYARVSVEHSTFELEVFQRRVQAIIRDIVHLRTNLDAGKQHLDVIYPNPTSNCSWDCDYRSICPLFDDGSRVEDMLTDNFRVHDPLERYEQEDKEGVA